MPKKMSCKSLKSNYIILFILLIIFMLAYIFSPIIQVNEIIIEKNQEPFYQNKFNNELLPIDKIKVYQGNGIPDIDDNPTPYDFDDPSLPSVDGESPLKSMNVFAFNKCDVKCCPYSPYSCSGGCVCMPEKQQNYLASRGHNSDVLFNEF